MPSEIPLENITQFIRAELGLAEDEIKVLFPTEQRQREFYAEYQSANSKSVALDDQEAPEDTLKLQAQHEQVLKQLGDQKELEAQEHKLSKQAKYERLQQKVSKDATVSLEEFLAAEDELNKLKKEGDDLT